MNIECCQMNKKNRPQPCCLAPWYQHPAAALQTSLDENESWTCSAMASGDDEEHFFFDDIAALGTHPRQLIVWQE